MRKLGAALAIAGAKKTPIENRLASAIALAEEGFVEYIGKSL
jgi:hypothetical protein